MPHKKNSQRSKARKDSGSKDPAPAVKPSGHPHKANAARSASTSDSNKAPAIKPTAKPPTTHAPMTRAPVTKAPAKPASTSPASTSMGSKPNAAREPEPPAALPKPAADSAPVAQPPLKLEPGARPALDALRGQPTEEIWLHYRMAVAERPRDEKWLEQLRNVLMEMHLPLVKHIAERLL